MKYILKRGEILTVEIINKGINETKVKILSNGQIETIENVNIYKSRKECRLVQNEINIKKAFKKKNSNKKGVLTCCKCNKKGKHLTVDHIVPLKAFGGRSEVRQDISLWKDVWDESNLQILCEDCNKIKGEMQQEEFNKQDMNKIYKRGMILNNKKNLLMAKNFNQAHKVGFGISTSRYTYDDTCQNAIIHLAKMDSRVLYSDLILK